MLLLPVLGFIFVSLLVAAAAFAFYRERRRRSSGGWARWRDFA